MIELNVLKQRYPCRTKDCLWYKEIHKTVVMMLDEQRTLTDIKQLSEEENIYNAVSSSRANEIRMVVSRRIQSVDKRFLDVFLNQDTQTQKMLSVVMVMLTDRLFFEFMDQVYREKLIAKCLNLNDSDIIGFIHSVQNQETNASKWTDAGVRKVRDNYKSILKEAGLISDDGTNRKIIRPIIKPEVRDFLISEGIGRIVKILAGERA